MGNKILFAFERCKKAITICEVLHRGWSVLSTKEISSIYQGDVSRKHDLVHDLVQ